MTRQPLFRTPKLVWQVAFLLLLLPLFATGQIPDPKPNTYINDHTNSLTAAEIQDLNEQLYALEQQTTIQVAVLLINTLPDDLSIEDYAREVGNRWKVGRAYNGLVYVAALQQRRQRLEVARNLEGVLPDITASRIIENLKPFLREQDYYNALRLLIAQISYHTGATNSIDTTTLHPAYNDPEAVQSVISVERSEYEQAKAKYDRWGNYAIGALVLSAIGFCIWAWRYKGKYVEMHTVNGVYMGIGSIYNPVSNDSSGGGGSSSFGGFGGSGGGGFSGGGASGSW